MNSLIRPHTYIALQLPSDALKILQVTPNTTISLGKYGSFSANHILGRPYHLTFEILDKGENSSQSCLRIVPAAEQYADINEDDALTYEEDANKTNEDAPNVLDYEVVNPEGKVVMRTNRNTVDDTTRQKLTMADIEKLKREETGSRKDLIAKILESHSALDQKTVFALAKYSLRKAKKFLKRFTVLPLDVPMLVKYILNEKEPMRIMELREETLALIGSWSNVHFGGNNQAETEFEGSTQVSGGRWLVVDETGGVLIAAMAERMGILYPTEGGSTPDTTKANEDDDKDDFEEPSDQPPIPANFDNLTPLITPTPTVPTTNTITLIHAASQPNLSLLSYFSFSSTAPSPSHPLTTHLRTLSWLQLLSPHLDSGYQPPPDVPPATLAALSRGKRANHLRKRRRWLRVAATVDSTRAGGFDGLVVASVMAPASILHHTVPLLRGGAQVAVYSPNVEPLAELADYYSTARRVAFITQRDRARMEGGAEELVPSDDFPLDPSLLLAPVVQTARARRWQVLPGRTHPVMTGRGGAEGYVFSATRVVPADGRVEARGRFKRRKTGKAEGRDVGGAVAGNGENVDVGAEQGVMAVVIAEAAGDEVVQV